jgi:hypothetical protein
MINGRVRVMADLESNVVDFLKRGIDPPWILKQFISKDIG